MEKTMKNRILLFCAVAAVALVTMAATLQSAEDCCATGASCCVAGAACCE
jgi:hypothetical protein